MHLSGKIEQKYLYNFLTVVYTDDSTIALEGTDIDIKLNDVFKEDNTVDLSLIGKEEGMPVNVYVEKKYTTEGSIPAEAVSADYMEPLGSDVKEIYEKVTIEHQVYCDDYEDPSNPGRPADPTMCDDVTTVLKHKNLVDHWIGVLIDDLGKNLETGYVLKSAYATVVPNENDYHSDFTGTYRAIGQSAILSENHWSAKNSVQAALKSNAFTKTVKNAFKEWNTCAALCSVEIVKRNKSNAVGIALNYYDDHIELTGEDSITLLGIVTLQNNGPLFIPLNAYGINEKDYNIYHGSIFEWWKSGSIIKTKFELDDTTCSTYTDLTNRNNLKRFFNAFKVNRKHYNGFDKGFFLQKSSDEVSIHDWASINGLVTTKPAGIIIKGLDKDLTQSRLSIADSNNLVFNNFEGIANYNDKREYSIELVGRNQPFKGFDENAWPYKAVDGVEEVDDVTKMSIAGLDQRMELMNSYIERLAEKFYDSEFYSRIEEGTAIGFYFNEDSKENYGDWKYILNSLNASIADSSYQRDIVPIFDIKANLDREDLLW